MRAQRKQPLYSAGGFPCGDMNCGICYEDVEVPDLRTQASAFAHLPADAAERKEIMLGAGCLEYFPDALIEVAKLSKVGNDQHNPGQPLHWEKSKSTDHDECILRHWVDRRLKDTDGMRHRAKVAWRALASLQIEIEAERVGMSYDDYIEYLKKGGK